MDFRVIESTGLTAASLLRRDLQQRLLEHPAGRDCHTVHFRSLRQVAQDEAQIIRCLKQRGNAATDDFLRADVLLIARERLCSVRNYGGRDFLLR